MRFDLPSCSWQELNAPELQDINIISISCLETGCLLLDDKGCVYMYQIYNNKSGVKEGIFATLSGQQNLLFTKICCGVYNILALDKDGKVYNRDIKLGKSDEWLSKSELNKEIIIDIKASGDLSYAKSKDGVHYLWNDLDPLHLNAKYLFDHVHPTKLNKKFYKATKKHIKDVYIGKGEIIIAA